MGEVCLVTGGSGGLGRVVCAALDGAGYQVAVHYHVAQDRAHETFERLSRPGMVVQADLVNWDQAHDMETAVRQALGPVSALVNCIGARREGLLATHAPAEWRAVIDANLIATFHAIRAILPRMLLRRSGRIVNVVSPAGLVGSPGQTAYAAAKAGVVGLTRSLAVECGRRGVTVNAVSPGFLDTNLTKEVPQTVRNGILTRTPLARLVTTADVAEAVVFLLGASGVTGQILSVDGGLTA